MTDTEVDAEALTHFRVRVEDPVHEALTESVMAADWRVDPHEGVVDFLDEQGRTVFLAPLARLVCVKRQD